MPLDLQCEAIAKFLIPDQPQEDNYPDTNEFKEKEEQWMEQWDLALAHHTVWVDKEHIAQTKHEAEATAVAAAKQKARCEAVECKQLAAARKKAGTIVEVLASGSKICARCSLKGLFSAPCLWLANCIPQGSSV